MPLSLRVGLSKSIGEFETDTVEVNCGIEIKLDAESLNDVDGLDQTIERAYFVCRDAINGELARHVRRCCQPPSRRFAETSEN